MKNHSLHHRLRPTSWKIVALWALFFLVLGALIETTAHGAEIRWISGARLNDGQLHGVNGGSVSLSPKWSLFAGFDLGGDLGAGSARGVRHFSLGGDWTISALIGANVEITEPPGDPYSELLYLNSSSGFVFTYKVSPDTHLWAAVDYLYPFPNHHPLKFGFGLSLRLSV